MLRRKNSRNAHRWVTGGRQESVQLLKRDDDQRQGTVTRHVLFQCRWKARMSKTGELIYKDVLVQNDRVLYVPIVELNRVGVAYINPADRFIDIQGRYWQPESDTKIEIKLLETHLEINCVRINPTIE